MTQSIRWCLLGALAASFALVGCSGGGGSSSGGGTASSGGSTASGGGSASSGGGSSSSGGGSSSSGGGSSSSGGGSASGGGTGGNIALTEFCGKLTKGYCDSLARCKLLDAAQVAACTADINKQCDSSFVAPARNNTTGYDGTKAQACIDQLNNLQCLDFYFGLNIPACSSTALFTPKGTAGAPCTSSSQCTGGFCKNNGAGNCSTCAPLRAAGDDCLSSTECGTGLVCLTPLTGGTAKCEAPRAVGSYCPSSSTASTACASGFCATGGNAADGGRACANFLSAGDLCTSSFTNICNPATQFCPTGLTDGGTTDGGTRRCTNKQADGTPCTTSTVCQTPLCNLGGVTDAGRSCGYVALNGACAGTGDCGPGAYCKGYKFGTIGTCAKRIALGGTCSQAETESAKGCTVDGGSAGGRCLNDKCDLPVYSLPVGSQCDNDQQCVGTAACHDQYSQDDGGLGSCKARVGEGGDCSDYDIFFDEFFPNDSFCDDGLKCNGSNICVPYFSAGGQCGADGGCKDYLYCDRDGGPSTADGICTPFKPTGSECNSSTVCQDNQNRSFCLFDGGFFAPTTGNLGQCSALIAVGQPCRTGTQCASGRCFRPDGGSGGTNQLDGGTDGVCSASCFP